MGRVTFRFSAKLVGEKYTKVHKTQIKWYISVKYNETRKNLKSFYFVPKAYAVYTKTFRWSIIVRL